MFRSRGSSYEAHMKVLVRPAHEGDIDAVIPLLRTGFGSHWPPETWRRLFEYPRVESQPNLGFVLESGDQLVGFLGAIYSERLVGGRLERFCNLSSWYTIPQFRNFSLKLLMAVLAQRGYTFTNLTPSEQVVQVLKAYGFRPLESHKLLCGPWWYRFLVEKKSEVPPRRFPSYQARRVLEMLIETPLLKGLELMRGSSPARFDHRGVHLLAGAELVRPMLSNTDQQLLDDHRQCGHFLVQGGRSYSYIVTVKRKIGFGRRSLVDFVVSDILHLSAREPALQHWQSLCQLIVGHEGSQAIMADERLFDLQCPKGLHMPCHSYFMSRSGVNPNQIDSLYTEIALLDEVFRIRPVNRPLLPTSVAEARRPAI
jgi:hypothetical protein